MNFILGCNYWASNAGTDMWQQFDIESIEQDLRVLSEHGIKHLRVFPNWRDFQPIVPQYSGGGALYRYITDCKRANTAYYLDEDMLDRFALFLSICERYHIQVIVGLITGWMSGALFTPSAFYGKNPLTDPTVIYYEQLFIRGFIERFRENHVIMAWDLGNECNCMGRVASRDEAAFWTSVISNAIRSADSTRPIISGMHGLDTQGTWTIQDQAFHTDMLTTHPYPFWCEHTHVTDICSLRTTLHPTAQTKYYAEIGGKPCLAEEIGTMGPMVCSDEKAADFLRVNLFSLWANGATGVMWWCACDQTELTAFPYSDNMLEQELGMMDIAHQPKPVLKEMKRFSEWLEECELSLPPAEAQAVCITTKGQDTWGVAYMTHLLTRTTGLNCRFAYGDDELPDADLYLLPSTEAFHVMPNYRFEELKARIYNGADLYLSTGNCLFSRFEEFVGVKIIDSCVTSCKRTVELKGTSLSFICPTHLKSTATTAEVIAYDGEGFPFLTVNRYGKGRVFWVNAPIEQNVIATNEIDSASAVYSQVFKRYSENLPIKLNDSELLATYHRTEKNTIVVLCNHSETEKRFPNISGKIDTIYYGDLTSVKPYDACVFSISNA